MARAAVQASASVAAPVAVIATSLVAPSPPRTMPSASSAATVRKPSKSAASSASSMTTPEAPLASANTQSLVEGSPSTVMALKVRRQASSSTVRRRAGSTAASVVR